MKLFIVILSLLYNLTQAGETPTTTLSTPRAPTSSPQNMKEYCQKYSQSVECKPTQVKEKLDSIRQMEDKKTDQKMKEIGE